MKVPNIWQAKASLNSIFLFLLFVLIKYAQTRKKNVKLKTKCCFPAPLVAPNFTVQETTSSSILVKWEAISEEHLRGFLQGYLVYVVKQQNDSSFARFQDLGNSLMDPGSLYIFFSDI